MAGLDSKTVNVTLLGAVVSALVTYVIQRVLTAWGVLDNISDALGKYLKLHVPPAAAGWTIALAIVLSLYALLLFKVWRPRHIHHGELSAAVAVTPSVEARFIPAARAHSDEDGSEANRKNELARKRAANRQGTALVRAKGISNSTITGNLTNAETLVDADQVEGSDISRNTQTRAGNTATFRSMKRSVGPFMPGGKAHSMSSSECLVSALIRGSS